MKRAELLLTKPLPEDTMMPEETVAKFADAIEKLEPINDQPSDTDLMQTREVLATLLIKIPYGKTEGNHNLIGLIRTVAAYTMRFGAEFSKPA